MGMQISNLIDTFNKTIISKNMTISTVVVLVKSDFTLLL